MIPFDTMKKRWEGIQELQMDISMLFPHSPVS